MGDHIPPVDGNVPVIPPALSQPVLSRTNISKVSDFLQENSRIGALKTKYEKYRRYVTLNIVDIYNALVPLYVTMILNHWPHYKRYMEQFTPPPGVTPWTYAARAYVSVWIHDLYVSNREAVKKLSTLAFTQHYLTERVLFSYEYDEFLIRLNATIRPTHIKGVMEDTLFIPLIANTIDWNDEYDPFHIPNFELNYDLVTGLIGIMKDRKAWKISPLVTDTLGRPAWLFDWHTDDRCCSWFPMEGNYNMEDVSLAYIIGVACTPKLGPRDVDDWQPFPGNQIPANINPNAYPRQTPRRFFGSYEVRTIATRHITPNTPDEHGPLTRKKAKGKATASKAPQSSILETEPSQVQDEPHPADEIILQSAQFQISDWTYYHLVVLNLDIHTRSGAIRMLAFN
nr:coat protein [Vitis cryptic virus]